MADSNELMFVYGSLMPNYGNYRAVASHVVSTRPASTRGILVDLGAFPAMLHGEGIVRGVLLEIDGQALKITDHIEGYSPSRESCLYVRERVTVKLDDGTRRDAWTYFFACPDRIKNRPRLAIDNMDGLPVFSWPSE